jgi:hypothetical protein
MKKTRVCVRERIQMVMASELLAVLQYLLVTTVQYYSKKISSLVIDARKKGTEMRGGFRPGQFSSPSSQLLLVPLFLSRKYCVFFAFFFYFIFIPSLRPMNSKLVSFVRPLYIYKYYDPDDVQKPRQPTVQDRSQLGWWRRDKFRDNWSVVCTVATHSAIIIEKARIRSQHDDKSLDITHTQKK